ncbi:hypothetical protein BOO92_20430 [Vibrio navarrensis]|uniref:helix-turn-helix domain-containing protein n=1 Tax=Vibrio navarrensis TaxID=29495 RepID=UPI00186944CB|nr:helix-turn-helix transcriptional regulator [Vibrio navarrensis]MBE3659037.1 hypothetical protein [Vibrio navarrensis]
MYTLSHLLRLYREKAELSQSRLAKQSGLSRSTIQRIESGRYQSCKPETILQALRACDIDLDNLDDWDIDDDILEKPRPKMKGREITGGSQNQRDKMFPELQDKDFKRWWHKSRKEGQDIQTREDCKALYDEWTSLGKPIIDLITKSDLEEILKDLNF